MSANHIGRGRFGDTTWRIQGENLTVGDRIKVQSVQGITLTVIKF
ncbi:MAG: NfeD family protein, partial [[Actinobacillus] rossii]|nr:NfeD family protein [[Actinobacillus] rossii]